MRCIQLSFLVLIALTQPSDSRPGPTTSKQDEQSAFEPPSEPGDGQQFLQRLVGNWRVSKTFYPRSGNPVIRRGECTQSMINGGRFLECKFEFDAGTDRATGLGIIGFDTDSGQFTSVWVDSRSTRMSIRHSEEKFDGKQIVLYNQSFGSPTTKPSHNSMTVTHLEDNGEKLIYRQFIRSKEAKERLVLELEMVRRVPSTAPAR